MKSRALRIDELRLRVPGLSSARARQLGETVAQRLAENPPRSFSSGRVPALSLRVYAANSASVEQLADTIAAKIHRIPKKR